MKISLQIRDDINRTVKDLVFENCSFSHEFLLVKLPDGQAYKIDKEDLRKMIRAFSCEDEGMQDDKLVEVRIKLMESIEESKYDDQK